jgi:hypothetical protein
LHLWQISKPCNLSLILCPSFDTGYPINAGDDVSIDWIPGIKRRAEDEREIARLGNLPEVQGKTQLFLRISPQKGTVAVLSFGTIGVTTDISLRERQFNP